MSQPETLPWNPANHLRTREEVVTYINATLKGEPAILPVVLSHLAEAVRRLGWEGSHPPTGSEALAPNELNPAFDSTWGSVKSLELMLYVEAVPGA